MDAFAEKARQALRYGSEVFMPITLDAHQKMLEDAGKFEKKLHQYQHSVVRFDKEARAFMDVTCKFVLDANAPVEWAQPELTSSAEPVAHTPPPQHAALFDRDVQKELADASPPALHSCLEDNLLQPVDIWLRAHASARERLPGLEKLRLQYDAVRRYRQNAALMASEEATPVQAMLHGKTPSKEKEEKAAAKEEKNKAIEQEFLTESQALGEQLRWLVDQSCRLKAHLAGLARAVRTSEGREGVPKDLLLPFPLSVLPPTSMEPPRPPQAYEMEGAGQHESRLSEEAMKYGVGLKARMASEELHGTPTDLLSEARAHELDLQEVDSTGKELVPLSPPTAAEAFSFKRSGATPPQDLPTGPPTPGTEPLTASGALLPASEPQGEDQDVGIKLPEAPVVGEEEVQAVAGKESAVVASTAPEGGGGDDVTAGAGGAKDQDVAGHSPVATAAMKAIKGIVGKS